MDKTIGISDLRNNIAEKIREVSEERSRYLIVQRSKARAVLIHPDELAALEKAAAAEKITVSKITRPAVPQSRKTCYEDFFGKQSIKP
jgi:prevent-host-death family protein